MSSIRTIFNLSLLAFTAITGLNALGGATIAAPQVEAAIPMPQRVRVFFPKNPEQQTNLSYVEPVWRQVTNTAVAQSAINQVLAGPTLQERKQGFVAPIKLSGASNCGQDFTLSIVSGVARLRFCKQVVSAGIGDDARAISSINATLKQFSTVRSVVILDNTGRCLGDMSGENRCLRR